MLDLTDYIAKVVNHIGDKFQDKIKRCQPLAGYIETTEISAIHAETPGIFVLSVGSGEMTPVETGEVDTTIRMVAYILVVNPDSLQREKTAYELVTKMLTFIPGNRWGLPNVFSASAVESADLHGLAKGFKPDVSSWRYGVSVLARASDLYGGSDPIANIALWAVTWEQILRIGETPEEDGMATPDHIEVRLNQDVEKVV